MSNAYTPQELARKAAHTKLMDSVARGVPHEVAFIRYLARLDKAGCPLHIPVGWYVDNLPAGYSPPPSPWTAVIASFHANKRDNPDWIAKVNAEVASEDRAEQMQTFFGCGFTLLMVAFLAWWLVPGVRSLVQRLIH